ncbi:MAG: hypothetical protein QXS69_01035, partial [Candidatus Aenigmatarchaeota archaeon]
EIIEYLNKKGTSAKMEELISYRDVVLPKYIGTLDSLSKSSQELEISVRAEKLKRVAEHLKERVINLIEYKGNV